MGRSVIPTECKRMRTMNVCITSTTEIEIWNHLESQIEKYIQEADEIKAKQNELIDYVHDTNPYKNFSWRKGRTPSRVKFEEWRKGIKEEEYEVMVMRHYDFKYDWKLCVKAFEWTKEENARFLEVSSWDHEIFNKHGYNFDTSEEFDRYECIHYKNSKKEWEINDIEWIQENKLKEDHRNHTEKVPDSCKFCVKDLQEEAERAIRHAKEEEQQRIWNEEWEAKRKEELENRELLSCDCCNFTTYSDDVYDKHLESKEHLRLESASKLYCAPCAKHCRSHNEYNVHIHSKKHKIMTGELEKTNPEFKCEKCNYTTLLKQNFDKHCLTKAHNEN